MAYYWGFHSILNIAKCNPHTIRNPYIILDFSRALVKRIDMVPYGAPVLKHFGEGNKSGYTLVQLIETSNICAHFVEESNDVYLDVFSCKEFREQDVKDIVYEYFKPEQIDSMFLVRQAKRME